jgi:hypothetical protein
VSDFRHVGSSSLHSGSRLTKNGALWSRTTWENAVVHSSVLFPRKSDHVVGTFAVTLVEPVGQGFEVLVEQ